MTTTTSRLAALGLAALVLTSACGDDNILEPTFGAGCLQGTLSVGQTVQGSLNSASCRQTYNFYVSNVIPYESWSVHLEAGQAYLFTEQQSPDPAQDGLNDVDAMLTLYGKDAQGRSVPLAVSDDEALGVDGHDSEFWFVAPKTGDYILAAGSYDWNNFGGYRLTMRSCPVLGVIDTAGTYTFPAPTSGCVRHGNSDAGVPLTYAFLSVKADSFETISVAIDHDASTAYYEMGGPDFDTYANIYAESESDRASGGSTASITMSEIPGLVTVGVGTYDFDAAGNYTVTVGRAFFAPPAPAPWLDGRLTLRAPKPKKTN